MKFNGYLPVQLNLGLIGHMETSQSKTMPLKTIKKMADFQVRIASVFVNMIFVNIV